jgi:ribonuclease HII
MLKRSFINQVIEAGCDEAGRGSLVGPVYAAAVILPTDFDYEGLDDSKKMSARKRLIIKELIERTAISYHVATASREEIERMNILNASILAMHRALDGLGRQPAMILVDGNRFKPYNDIQHTCIVKGDGLFMSIAAASVLAKTCRDAFMLELHNEYPKYGWDTNKGYATKGHLDAIRQYGLTPHHRKSFLANIQTRLFFK